MAECYQKLGDAESRKIYERLVREYAEGVVDDAAGVRHVAQVVAVKV